jgi:hypothetical protein
MTARLLAASLRNDGLWLPGWARPADGGVANTQPDYDCAETLFDSYITVRSRSDRLNANAVTDDRVTGKWFFLLPRRPVEEPSDRPGAPQGQIELKNKLKEYAKLRSKVRKTPSRAMMPYTYTYTYYI